jgi:hypothetical protein
MSPPTLHPVDACRRCYLTVQRVPVRLGLRVAVTVKIRQSSNERMPNKIPAEELRRTEAKCNALFRLQEDYHHLISSLEGDYGASVQERHLRKIIGGGAGPEQIVLEESGA